MNGGYPCIGPTLQYGTCATNVTCPSKYSNNIDRYKYILIYNS